MLGVFRWKSPHIKFYAYAISFILLAFARLAHSAERADVCVKYEKEYGWSKGYSVEGTVISGSDLNLKVGSLSRFKAFSTYVVIFWEKDQTTILELSPMSMGSVPMFESDASDQEGRKWRIKEGHSFCF